MLRVEDIHKSFDDFKAVNGAKLTVDKGELVAVIGPNGAGKTTLFNLISGQLKADKGKVIFNEEDMSKLPTYEICRRGVARSFQSPTFFTAFQSSGTSRSRCSPSRKRATNSFGRPRIWLWRKQTVFWKVWVFWTGRSTSLAPFPMVTREFWR